MKSRERGILLESGTNEVEFLEFSVAGHLLGVNVAKVSQALVLDELEITHLPGGADWFVGSVYFRGLPIPVIHLGRFLGIEEASSEGQGRLLLVLEFNSKINGFVVDKVDSIRRVSWNDFKAIQDGGEASSEMCVTGTVTIEDRIVLILDMEQMMARVDPSMNVEYYVDAISQHVGIDRDRVRILYAEDSAIVQKVTMKILRDAGFTDIRLMTTGRKALDYLLANPETVDVVISDIEMPEMDGLTFCRQVRQTPAIASIPFIFYSSLINDQMKKKCESVGGDASLAKPEIHLIVSTIEQLLSA
ncbi:MAG: chemotaxis protein [bacterium]|nr:chemotaxis protein [bacterium]